MKPIKLTINAFGPYVNETEIDFTKFGENGIYLITGDTGAGKTTIFDALSYALFGEASGSSRNTKSLRSDFADENNKSYVKFEFLSHGDKYIVKRECPYKKINRNGREVTESEKAELIKPNKETFSRPEDVTREIENILGINKKQFAQIVMIAQGEFQKFLNAPTKDKEEIFRNIFNTYYYSVFQQKIKDEFFDKNAKKQNEETRLAENIKAIDCSDDEELKKLKEENNVYDLTGLLECLKESVNSDDEKLKTYNKQYSEIEKEIQKLTEQIREHELIENDRKNLENLQSELPKIEDKKNENEKKYSELKNKEQEREALSVQIDKLRSSIPEYEVLAKTEKDLKKAELTLENKINELENLHKDLARKKADKEKKEERLKEIENVDTEYERATNDNEKILERANILQDLKKSYVEYIEEIQNIKSLEKKLESEIEIEKELEKIAKKKYETFLCNQAGFLAEKLKDGEECPVCGAIHHPKKAELTVDVISREDVDNARNDSEKAKKRVLDLNEDVNKLKNKNENGEKQLLKDANKIFSVENMIGFEEELKKATDKNNEDKNSLKSQLDDLKKKQKEKRDLKAFLEDFEKNQTEQNTKKEEINDQISDLNSQKASLEATIKEKQSKLEYKSSEEAKKVLECNEKILNKMKKEFQEAENAKNKSSEEFVDKKAKIEQIKEKLKNTKVVDIEKMKQDKEEKDKLKKGLDAEKTRIYSRHSNNSRQLTEIEKYNKTIQEISSEVEMLDRLNRTANGNLVGGKQKITFENYILSSFFEEIIEAANKRFREMTSSQFELRRNVQKGGNSKTGLDLDVYDYYTAKSREISTLSGGESFKAALALSLGLSDIVQQKAGGVQIDTMFIDEGFGSLDPESLEQTMRTLIELSGNRTLIGIISHVAELREKIDKKILVTKTQSGSKLKIELP